MKYCFRISAALLLFPSFSVGQNTPVADSLEQALKTQGQDSNRVKTLVRLAWEVMEGKSDKAERYSSEALLLSEKIGFSKGKAEAIICLGLVQNEKANYDSALFFYFKALPIQLKLKDNRTIGNLYNNIGLVYYRRADYPPALDYFLKSLVYKEASGNKNAIASSCTSIGNLYTELKNYTAALKYQQRSLQLYKETGNEKRIATTLNNIGAIYNYRNEIDTALACYQQAERISDKIGDKRGLAISYGNIGSIKKDQGKYMEAIRYIEKGLALGKELKSISMIIQSENTLAYAYLQSKNYQRSGDFFKMALEHALQIGSKADQLASYQGLAELSSANGEFKKAAEFLELYASIKDSIYNETSSMQLNELQEKYEAEKKGREIQLLKKEGELKSAELVSEKQFRNFVIIGGLALLLVFYLFYSRYRLKEKMKLQQQMAALEQKALRLQMNPHFIFNTLNSIQGLIAENKNSIAKEHISQFAGLMRTVFEHAGEQQMLLKTEVEMLHAFMTLTHLRFPGRIAYDVKVDVGIDPEDITIPSMLLQPFVENAVLHGIVPSGKEGRISVQFSLDANCLVCTVQDNGIGRKRSAELNKKRAADRRYNAIQVTQERLEALNVKQGKGFSLDIIDLNDAHGNPEGTKVMIRIPLENNWAA